MLILFGPCPLNEQVTQLSHIHMHALPQEQMGVSLVFSHLPRQVAVVFSAMPFSMGGSTSQYSLV